MAELADALGLGSSTARCEGSSPFIRIINFIFAFAVVVTLPITLLQQQGYDAKHIVIEKINVNLSTFQSQLLLDC